MPPARTTASPARKSSNMSTTKKQGPSLSQSHRSEMESDIDQNEEATSASDDGSDDGKAKRNRKTGKQKGTEVMSGKKDSSSRKKKNVTYYEKQDEDEDETELDSDALDEDSDGPSRKRKRASKSLVNKRSPKSQKASPRKRRMKARHESEDEEDGLDLKEGQEVVGVVVKAPKTGRVPPGQISTNTLNFLAQLQKPECNDREWYPVYRLAEKEWKDFVDEFTPLLIEVDPQIPHLPPKDVIHRIYRDIRFSNDKTPYKTGLTASFSRSGRKGIFAGFEPGGESLIAAGTWCPGKNELATIRSNILRSSTRLRSLISSPEFVRYFGEPRPHPRGERQNIFGMQDELKVAPKGIEKTHKDIDLLKCRSFAVIYRFMDSEVLEPDFKETLCKVIKIVQPFVHCLNDMMTIQDADDSQSGEGGGSSSEDD
ncbi:uncharacterized protein LAESUDRAFT_724064 [Laetiporus sulphureus 93-53]|uniref:Uncharacterized protein n=1 Tax=Laetiporus sulphureus 93-53 TaxID=1314785 RepID=A0A165EZY0_9APHY|nr:uncharacterized protein LAESUDRAFT_724064 [Laetiporus sulphureus 93-53]KZT08078.1 hypothetical protein LAESUDRAFT_724064 [Laetiporus sulphureus 93-53]